MRKKLCWLLAGIMLVLLAAISPASTVDAGNFVQLADTGRLQLRKDGKWEKEYKSNDGDVKIRFRNLRLGPDSKRYHMMIWWRDAGEKKYRCVADGYCHKNNYNYAIQVYWDRDTKRVFFVLDAWGRIIVYGYDTWARRFEEYIDSNNYYSPWPMPSIALRQDRDLELRFDNGTSQVEPTRYRLFWDVKNNWFGYEDITVRTYTPTPGQSVQPAYDSAVRNAEKIYEGVD